MKYFDLSFWALFGMIIGSFVNVCTVRLPLESSNKKRRLHLLNSQDTPPYLRHLIKNQKISLFLPARSFCFWCGHQLNWLENIPIFSYLFFKGHCNKCKNRIGQKIFWTEAIHGLFYLGNGWLLNGFLFPLASNICFSYLWVLCHCWYIKQLRNKIIFFGTIIVFCSSSVYSLFIIN